MFLPLSQHGDMDLAAIKNALMAKGTSLLEQHFSGGVQTEFSAVSVTMAKNKNSTCYFVLK
jgi:hypothetical protein